MRRKPSYMYVSDARPENVIDISKDYAEDDNHKTISNKPKEELVLHKGCIDRYTKIKSKR